MIILTNKSSFFCDMEKILEFSCKQGSWFVKLILFDMMLCCMGSKTIAPPRKIAPIPKLNLTQTLTLTRGQFSSGAIVYLPPTLKLTLTLTQTPTLTGGIFSSGCNCPDTVAR